MCISYRVGCPHSPLPTCGSGGSGIGSIRRNGSTSSQGGRSCRGWPSTTCLGDKSEKRSKSTVVLRVPSSKIAFASLLRSVAVPRRKRAEGGHSAFVTRRSEIQKVDTSLEDLIC